MGWPYSIHSLAGDCALFEANMYRSIATMIASLIGGVGVLALAVFGYLFFGSSSDCNSNVGGFYENNSALCYNKEKVSTLTGKSNGKATPITKFVILDQDKALVYPQGEEPQIILVEDDKFKVYPYATYKSWKEMHGSLAN